MALLDPLRDCWYQVLGYMAAGGMVMWPLALVSLLMWLLIIERLLYIGRLYRHPLDFEDALRLIEKGGLPEKRHKDGAVGRLVALVLSTSHDPRNPQPELLDGAVRYLERSLSNHLTTIGVLAAVAPLLGLLGTVTGMITTFDVLSIFGTGNARAMAGGISEALITTQTGLLVAIPGLYMKGFLERRAANLAKRITAAGLYLRRQLSPKTPPASTSLSVTQESSC